MKEDGISRISSRSSERRLEEVINSSTADCRGSVISFHRIGPNLPLILKHSRWGNEGRMDASTPCCEERASSSSRLTHIARNMRCRGEEGLSFENISVWNPNDQGAE
jgi:hypothetical protein